MTRDVFRRLALVAGCTAWSVAIALVWVHVGWAAGVFALIAGPAGAYLLSLEAAPPATSVEKPEDPRGLSHREIARRARAARAGDDD